MVRQHKLTRFLSGFGALVLLIGLVAQILVPSNVLAAGPQPIQTPRSLTLEAGTTNGGSDPGGTVKHLFNFKVDGSNSLNYNVGSISFQYCTTADAVTSPGIGCYMPPGLNLASATITTDSGGITGFNTTPVLSANEDTSDPNNGKDNTMTIELASAVTINAATSINVEFNSVVNPDNTECYSGTAPASNNCTFYVRVYAYAGTGGGTVYTNTSSTTTAEDYGVVAASTATPISLTGNMPESLTFCTGGTIGVNTGSVPDCSTATSGNISFDRLFSPTDTAQATSQMAASTNANNGYSITVNGTTLEDGSYSIAGMGATSSYSVQGTPQFGMNLVKNTAFCGATCDLGANVTQTGGTLYNGEATTNYATGGGNCTSAGCAKFAFNTGDSVADSLLGNGSTGASDGQIYTVSYIVNVPGSQAAGTYATTLTYICTPTF